MSPRAPRNIRRVQGHQQPYTNQPLSFPTSSPTDNAEPLLRAEGLECLRGDNLLFEELNLALQGGQLLQIEGANGSGKTSLLRILAGLSRASAGAVFWQGFDIQERRADYFSAMAYLGHALGIKGELSALENLKIALALSGVAYTPETLYDALARTGLEGREDIPARALSAGQKQRVAMARLLACPARLWIMDEPYTALDVDGVALLRALLETHLSNGGLVVLTSHQAVEVRGEVVKWRLS